MRKSKNCIFQAGRFFAELDVPAQGREVEGGEKPESWDLREVCAAGSHPVTLCCAAARARTAHRRCHLRGSPSPSSVPAGASLRLQRPLGAPLVVALCSVPCLLCPGLCPVPDTLGKRRRMSRRPLTHGAEHGVWAEPWGANPSGSSLVLPPRDTQLQAWGGLPASLGFLVAPPASWHQGSVSWPAPSPQDAQGSGCYAVEGQWLVLREPGAAHPPCVRSKAQPRAPCGHGASEPLLLSHRPRSWGSPAAGAGTLLPRGVLSPTAFYSGSCFRALSVF